MRTDQMDGDGSNIPDPNILTGTEFEIGTATIIYEFLADDFPFSCSFDVTVEGW